VAQLNKRITEDSRPNLSKAGEGKQDEPGFRLGREGNAEGKAIL
jgi:hypothetical protein